MNSDASKIPEYDFRTEIKYPMTIINLEDFSVYNPNDIKCTIPLLMPMLSKGDPEDEKIKAGVSHVQNKTRPSPEQFTSCNYVKVNISQEIAFACPRDKAGTISKGQKFICVFLNGELDAIRVIGIDK